MHIRSLFSGAVLWMCITPAFAQDPPATVEWSVLLPYGSEDASPARITVDQGVTYWMLFDVLNQWDLTNGVLRRYDPNGLSLTGFYPEVTSIGCSATLDHAIDFFVRNDSIWGIASWQQIAGPPQDILFCAQYPGGSWNPDNTLNGPELQDNVFSMLVSGSHRYLCARHETSYTHFDSRVVALDLAENVIWDTTLPAAEYGAVQSAADFGDSIGVAAFPDLYWLDATNGLPTSTTQLYTGGSGHGVVLHNGTDMYWAANDSNAVHYGKLDLSGNEVWSGTAPAISVNAIAVDDLGRLWIGGNGATEGKLIKVEADGTYTGTYTNGATITDVDFSNGRLSWTGQLTANDPTSYLINSTPNP